MGNNEGDLVSAEAVGRGGTADILPDSPLGCMPGTVRRGTMERKKRTCAKASMSAEGWWCFFLADTPSALPLYSSFYSPRSLVMVTVVRVVETLGAGASRSQAVSVKTETEGRCYAVR